MPKVKIILKNGCRRPVKVYTTAGERLLKTINCEQTNDELMEMAQQYIQYGEHCSRQKNKNDHVIKVLKK